MKRALEDHTQAATKSLAQLSITRLVSPIGSAQCANAHRIILLNNGEIGQTGHYDELVA